MYVEYLHARTRALHQASMQFRCVKRAPMAFVAGTYAPSTAFTHVHVCMACTAFVVPSAYMYIYACLSEFAQPLLML
jgi:hypothetical protein